MELTFILDGQDRGQPINWKDLSESLTYDPINQVYSFAFGEEYVWQGNAYNYLMSRVTGGNLFELVSVEVRMDGRLIVKGNIVMSDVTFQEYTNPRTATTTIEDDGFSSRVKNNKNIPVAPIFATSKNGAIISVPSPTYTAFFDNTGNYALTANVAGYYWREMFTYLVDWMTDGTVDFASDYFTTGAGAGMQISTGYNVRMRGDANPAPPKIEFDRLYTTARKLFCIGMGFTRNSITGRYTLHIEPLSWFRSNDTQTTLQSVNAVELSFLKELLYSTIQVGSAVTTPNNSCNDSNSQCGASVSLTYIGCEQEIYGLGGECNIDSQLDLSPDSKFIYDTNSIIDIFQFGNDRNDNDFVIYDTVLMTLPPPATAYAVLSDPTGIGENWYNGILMNDYVINRWIDYLSGSLTPFGIVSGQALFEVTGVGSGVQLPLQDPTYTTVQTNMTTTVYDPDSVYALVTDRFTPIYEGLYQIYYEAEVGDFPSSPSGVLVNFQLVLEHYDSSATLIQSYSSGINVYLTGDPRQVISFTSPYITTNSGDYIKPAIAFAQLIPPGFLQAEIDWSDLILRCVDGRSAVPQNPVTGGDGLALFNRKFSFPISDAIYYGIVENTSKQVAITMGEGYNAKGWIKSIKRNFVDGFAEVELMSIE